MYNSINFIAIIPARFYSTRLPGKPLMDINGKPMIIRVIERVKCSKASKIIVSTDHNGIAEVVKDAGEEVCLTSSNHESGTERIKETIDYYGFSDNQIIVNIQGDEPLISPQMIDKSVESLLEKKADITTVATPILELKELTNPDIVKVIINMQGYALYFSRFVNQFNNKHTINYIKKYNYLFRHVGIYVYRVNFIRRYVCWSISPLEKIEFLEQLRVLWNNEKIYVSTMKEKINIVNVNTMEQLIQVRNIYKYIE